MESMHSEGLNQEEPLFYLFKHRDIDGLQLPLKGSSRVKYVSFNVSTNYIALGTNAGGIHIFRRSSLRHCTFLNAKVFLQPDSSRIVDVSVTALLFCTQEKCLAAALSSGHVAVWALNFDQRKASQLVKKTDEHKGSTVTCLCWNSISTKLFIGDSKGCISGLEVSSGKMRSVHIIIKEGPAIVQLDFANDQLLVSTTKKCVYYDPSKDQFLQIGTKPRDGLYGACFLHQINNSNVVYCARPGARLWEVDSTGQVLSTQQYKKLLATSSSPITGHVTGDEKSLCETCDVYNFPKLLVLREQFLITWSRENIIIVDPMRGNLVLWNSQLENIEDIWCNRQEIYVFHSNGRLTRYSLIPPKECAAKLFVMGEWLQCSKVLVSCQSQIVPVSSRDHVPKYVVRRVKEMLNDDLQHQEIVNELSTLEENLELPPNDPANEDDVIAGASLFDESESQSITSDFMTDPDIESMVNTSVGSSMEDVDDTTKKDKKERLTKLKNVFKDQLKEFSLDTVLLAGAQAAGHMSFSSSFTFGGGGNPFSSSLEVKHSRYDTRSPSDNEETSYDVTSSSLGTSNLPGLSTNKWVGSSEDIDSDIEEEKNPIVFKEKKKKKVKVNTIDLVSPLQPTDLIKLETSKAMYKGDVQNNFNAAKIAESKVTGSKEQDSELNREADSCITGHTEERIEGLHSRSVAAKQEVVEKARKFLKRLTPDEKDLGTDAPTNVKEPCPKGISTNIISPLQVKSLVIVSRDTRKKIREDQGLYNPNALKSMLFDWIVYLEKTNIAVNLIYPKNQDGRDYYVTDVGKVLSPAIKADLTRFLDADDTMIVAELTTMCFKMKLYSSSSGNDCDMDSNELTMEEVVKCNTCKQKENSFSLNIDAPQVFTEPQSNEAKRIDLAKTKFFCDNFQLLNYQTLKGPIIADCLNQRALLKNLLRCLDDFTERDAIDDAIDTGDTKVALQLIREKAESYQKRLLRHVFRLYYLVPRDVAKLCAEIYPYLDPWEVVLVYFSTSTNLYSNCSDFLIYITHLIQSNDHAKKDGNSFTVLDTMDSSEDFMILIYHSALILDDLSDSDVRCHCGWPRPGSHKTSFQYEELMIAIMKHFKVDHDNGSLEKLFKISWNHGYWQGCIQLLVMLELRTKALELTLQLRDISLVDSVQMWGWLPQSPSEWKFGLEYLNKCKFQDNCTEFEKNTYSEIPEADANNEKLLTDKRTITASLQRSKQSEVEFQIGDDQLHVRPENASVHGIKNSANSDDRQPKHHACIKRATSEHGHLHAYLKAYVLVMLQNLGAQSAIKLIANAGLHKDIFMEEFYYKCILCSLLKSHESHLSHRILCEVDDHMWSFKCAEIVPQVLQIKEVERLSSNKEELFNAKEPLKYCRSLEDAACNWGISLQLAGSTCELCPLPLCELLPGYTEGVIIFPCGHLYHKECNLENFCWTCFHNYWQLPLNIANALTN